MASSGHLCRCSDADTTNQCLSRVEYASILSWPTIMGHYKLWIAIIAARDTIWPSTEELVATKMASSGHLRRCSDADTTNQCLSRVKDASIPSWPTIMGHYKLWIAIITARDTI
eukprot:scaffold10696_cov79-Skeletonema_dohrnii-CCMP3373.AAC.1